MQNEKMREEFEDWHSKEVCRLVLLGNAKAAFGLEVNKEAFFYVWQASRESQVIDLDAAAKALAESMDYPWEFMPEQGLTRMIANARMVIEAAGLKVKP